MADLPEDERAEEALADETISVSPTDKQEHDACTPIPVNPTKFNPAASIPYGLTIEHIRLAMEEMIDFLGFVNQQLNVRDIRRFEAMLMPANFSSMVGEFIVASIPKYCPELVKNQYHNGHPDLIPKGKFPGNSAPHGGADGIEVKGSRYAKGWQGHNAEDCWLMVIHFDSNRPADLDKGIPPRPFRFVGVYFGRLTPDDWKFSPRKEGSRRTPTASVMSCGYDKMRTNWIYYDDSRPVDERASGEIESESEQ